MRSYPSDFKSSPVWVCVQCWRRTGRILFLTSLINRRCSKKVSAVRENHGLTPGSDCTDLKHRQRVFSKVIWLFIWIAWIINTNKQTVNDPARNSSQTIHFAFRPCCIRPQKSGWVPRSLFPSWPAPACRAVAMSLHSTLSPQRNSHIFN